MTDHDKGVDSKPFRHVVKVGGSLLRAVETTQLVCQWLCGPEGEDSLVICGGGQIADLVRMWDQQLGLPKTEAHHLAIEAMVFNLRLLRALMPVEVEIVDSPDQIKEARQVCRASKRPLFFNVRSWVASDWPEQTSWDFTSDSIAACLAHRVGSQELTLLKSCCPEDDETAASVVSSGIVDPQFRNHAGGLAGWRIVDLASKPSRSWRSG